jgi:hypothetical protein
MNPRRSPLSDPSSPAGPVVARALSHVAAIADGPPVDRALRVTVHFHPDRRARDTFTLAAIARDGVYRSQFVTGTGNGGLTAYPGGDRWRWESRMFGGAYDDADPADRPVYGSLNFRRRPGGGSPRFGSAHLRLTEAALDRATFCYPDSHLEPSAFGTATAAGVLALAAAGDVDLLDDYVEAQVHGPVRLDADVEALVLDPCYRGTEVEAVASALPCPVEWHHGFRLPADELRWHPDYRGPELVELGAALAVGAHLDARIIGDASRLGHHDEQALKRVWHYVARFGTAAAPAAR